MCPSCECVGTLTSGLPGVLSNGERCDTCRRVPSDRVAARLLAIFNFLQTASCHSDPDMVGDGTKALNSLYAIVEEMN